MSRNSKTPRSLRSILLRDQGNLLPIPPGYTALGMSGGQMVMGKPDGSVQPISGSGNLPSSSSPITVANAAARKDPATYTDGAQVGATRVIQLDLPNLIWDLVAADVTQDSSWIGQPYTVDPSGQIVINLEISDVAGTIPDDGVLGRVGKQLTLGDGNTVGGVKVNKGAPFYPTLLINDDESVEAYMLNTIPNDWKSSFGDEKAGLRIGDGVTRIGYEAFGFWSSNNQPLVIPDSVTSIEGGAFRDWSSNAQPLVIGNSVTAINDLAFTGWASNNHPLVIGNSVLSIGDFAFDYWAVNSHPLVIPDTVTTISYGAFYDWPSNNQPLVIGTGVTSIGSIAFNFWSSNSQPIHIACPFSAFSGAEDVFGSRGPVPAIYVLPDKGWTLGTQNFQGLTDVTIAEWTSYPALMP